MRFALLSVVAVLLAIGPVRASEELTFFRIGTGATATTSYALGTAISAGISSPPGSATCNGGRQCGVPGLIAVAQTQQSPAISIRAMARGDLESALVPADTAYWAYIGSGPFAGEGPFDRLRVIANLVPFSLHIVVDADSGIESVAQLRGKRVSLGLSGAETETLGRHVLRVHGVGLDEVRVVHLRPGPAADAILGGQIDAMFILGAEPVAAISELAEDLPIRLLSISGEPLRQLHSLYPFVTQAVLPEGTYEGAGEALTVSIGVKWLVMASYPEQLVRAITRALWEGRTEEMFKLNNPYSRFADRLHATQTSGIPLHPGAEAYYRAAGMM